MREGVKACKKIFREFKPDVVIGTGGYASFPALYAAQSMGIPTCVHESNAVPGVTTRLAANKASRVLVAFEESVRHYKHPEKVEVVGMPVRREFIFDTKEGARKELGLSGFVVVSAFGSQGAKVMNETIADMIPLEQADGFPFHHIHAAGKSGWALMESEPAAQQSLHRPGLDIRPYIDNMAEVMRAADLVICRAGASTVSEITALGVPAVIVPSPYVTNNHQEKNARILEQHGGAALLLEKDATGDALYDTARGILDDPEKRASMSRAMAELGIPDATERIFRAVMALVKK